METVLITSNLILWVLVIALSLTVYALVRQVGVLYERVAPAGALMISQGPKVGQPAPVRTLMDINSGQQFQLGGLSQDGKATLLFFLSTSCPVCESLIPILKSLAIAEASWLEVILTSDGEEVEHKAFVQRKNLDVFRYALSTELGMAFQVGKLPYAVLIDREGIVRGHGLTNNREHLESLFEAMNEGIASIQEYQSRGQTRQNPMEVQYHEPS